MMQALLSNPRHPEYGAATSPVPIPRDEYDHCIELLEALEIGDVMERDCKVEEIQGGLPILKRLEKAAVNIDELDYLVKRLDSFSDHEMAQFQGMAVKTGIFNTTDLINLAFCCQQATVITNFSDLEVIGRDHIMSINGGCAPSELAQTDLRMTALKLILSKEGTVTPYGVVYDNGMQLEYLYVEDVLELHRESIYNLNELAAAVKKLSPADRKKLGAAVVMAEPEYAFQICHLAENLDLFEFAPEARTPVEYGRYMIQKSGHFAFDPNLEEFYDYEKYGLQRMEQVSGMFTDSGYISYQGTLSLEELMMEEPSEQGFQMGGMA